ncbi:hypothetical protein BJX96DRAFT_30722 [Aspergillus floccosus]
MAPIVTFLCLALAAVGMAAGDQTGELLHSDPSISGLVHNAPTFPAIPPRPHKHLRRRKGISLPVCSDEYGTALQTETVNNINHLSDVKDDDCTAPAASCTRVSHDGASSIFFCTFEDHDISTNCGDLIQPAKDISNACQWSDGHTHGYVNGTIRNEQGEFSYLLIVADHSTIN